MPGKRKAIKQPDGSYLVELKPGGERVRTVAEPDDFDAHQFEVLHAAANQLPRTARGGARDLAPEDARPAPAPVSQAKMTDMPPEEELRPRAAHIPVLSESVEARPPASDWDTVYVSPQEKERRRRAQAAAIRARTKHAEDVSWYDPETPVSL
jgi:hypothetical protein